MPRAEIASKLETRIALSPRVINTDTTTVGAIIDLQENNRGAMLAIMSGTVTDGSYVPLIEEGDASNLSDASAVADADLYRKGVAAGQEADATFVAADDNKIKKISYLGKKRYIRLSIVSTGTTTGALISAFAILDPELQDVGDNA
jgi:hydrogenase maturation factor